jgi:hypothetical protein
MMETILPCVQVVLYEFELSLTRIRCHRYVHLSKETTIMGEILLMRVVNSCPHVSVTLYFLLTFKVMTTTRVSI